jgi:hypothetical protein
VNSVVRPESGSISVVVKADGQMDATVVLTPDSPDEIQVTMRAKRANPAATVVMPPNPYE